MGFFLEDRILFQTGARAGKASLKDYVMKDASRVAGPWADHVIYRGQDLIKRSHRPGALAETF